MDAGVAAGSGEDAREVGPDGADHGAPQVADLSVRATRLLPPRLGPRVLHRPRLVERIVERQDGRLTSIVARAGFGKTTLAADAVASMDGRVAWLTCDPGTNTLPSLGRHLVAAIERAVPGFGAALTIAGRDPEETVTAIVNELVAVGSDRIVVVMDDVHHLTGDAARVPGELAADLPGNTHLVLVSREAPPFSLARLRLAGVCELAEADLALTEEEVVELFRLQDQDVARAPEVHRRTEGWPAAVTLVARPVENPADGVAVAAPRELIEYLTDEVLDLVGADGQRLLDATALCGRVTPRMAQRALDDPGAGEVLRRLAESSFLVARLEGAGEWFRYHAILREFLADRVAALGPGERRALDIRTADAWLEEGEIPEAVNHLIAAGEHERAVDLAASVADAMSASDQAHILEGWLERLPPEVVDSRAALIAASGTLLFGARRYDAAFDRLLLGVTRLLEEGAGEMAAISLFRLLEVLETAGEFTRGVAVCETFLPALAGADELIGSALRLRLANFLGNLGRSDEADAILTEVEASEIAEAAPVLRTYAQFVRGWAVDHAQGRSREALARLTRAAERLEDDPEGDILRLLPWVYALRGVIDFTLVEDEQLAVDIARFAELAPRYGVNAALAPIIARARMLQMLRSGRLDELDLEISRWNDHFVAWRDVNWNYHYFPIAAAAHLLRGRNAQALGALQHFRDSLSERAPLIEQARLFPDCALLAMQAGDEDFAARMVVRGVEAAGRTGAPWALVHANAVGAVIHSGTPAGRDHLERALEASSGGDAVDAWARIDRSIAAGLLATAMAEGLGPEGVAGEMTAACGGEVVTECARLLSDAPARARLDLARAVSDSAVDAAVIEDLLRDRDPAVRRAARDGWGRRREGARARVDIASLGPLTILRDGRRVDAAVFARQKSRALLAALLAAGGSVHRDRLSEWLWPDLTPTGAAASLRSTLHDLRRGIEPEVEVGSPQALIRSDGDWVRLKLGDGDSWDLLRFRSHLARARAAGDPAGVVAELIPAERLAAGPFLAEFDHEDWAWEERNEVERELAGLRIEMSDAFMSLGRPQEAIPRLRALCKAEPERQEWHRRLMRAYEASGERALALRQFHVLRSLLRRGQGVEPDEGTRALYQEILVG